MSNYFTTKQIKAIKPLLSSQDLDCENIEQLKDEFRNTDTSGMTLEEAQRIYDSMSPQQKDYVGFALSNKIQETMPQVFYDMNSNLEEPTQQLWFKIIKWMFIIGLAVFGIVSVYIAFTGVWGFVCGLLALA